MYVHVCMCACAGCVFTCMHELMWGSEDNLQKLILSFYCVASGD